MESDVSKGANRGLNIGLLLIGIITIILLLGLFHRIGSPRPDPSRVYNPGELLGDVIQVDVRNGAGESGLAGEMTDFLRSYGFDVVEHGDHTSFDMDSTLVIDRIGNVDAANQVALALGISPDRVISDIKPDYYLDVSVIIGADFPTIEPFRNEISNE